MNLPLSPDEFWDILSEKITLGELQAKHVELERQRLFDESVAAASIIFTKKLMGISTCNLLKMRWSCPYRILDELFPGYPRKSKLLKFAYQHSLRTVLATRTNISHGRGAKAIRRRMAQMHHGGKKK